MIDYICSNGGYSDRHTRFALEYNVKAYSANLDFDNLLKIFDHGDEALKTNPVWLAVAKQCHTDNEDRLWEWGIEDARRNVDDGDGYWMPWDGERAYNVEHGFYGRQGGHLCIESFEGRSLKLSPESLENEMMQGREDGYGDANYWAFDEIKKLYKMCRQWEVDFTPDKASREVEYQAAFCLFANIVEPAWEQHLKDSEDHDTLVKAARLVHGAVEDVDNVEYSIAFNLLASAAGVTQEEVHG